MNINNAKDYLPLVQALVDGKTIQFSANGNNWVDADLFFDYPAWYYRIKPEVKKGKYRVALCSHLYQGKYATYTTTIDKEYEESEMLDNSSDFVQWLTDWVEYELPESES